MAEKLEPRVHEGTIEIPYQWTTGPIVGRFFTELRDNRKIMGARCPKCHKVWVPPSECCIDCHEDLSETDLVGVSDQGTITSFTLVQYPLLWRVQDPPYAIVSVRLEGASTDLLHLVTDWDSLGRLEPLPGCRDAGRRVRAVWRSERTGTLLDIERFEVV